METRGFPQRMIPIGRLLLSAAALLAMAVLSACAATGAQPSPTASAAPVTAPAPSPTALLPGALETLSGCAPDAVVVPTLPAEIPGYTQLDPSTNLHVTGDPVEIDLTDYRLKISGLVAHPLELTYDQLRCLPRQEVEPVLICPGYFEDVANWAGVPLRDLLGLAQPLENATQVTFHGADGYNISFALEDALLADNLIAYEWEGEPLPILHGFPVRAIMPTMQGSRWVKWLLEIELED